MCFCKQTNAPTAPSSPQDPCSLWTARSAHHLYRFFCASPSWNFHISPNIDKIKSETMEIFSTAFPPSSAAGSKKSVISWWELRWEIRKSIKRLRFLWYLGENLNETLYLSLLFPWLQETALYWIIYSLCKPRMSGTRVFWETDAEVALSSFSALADIFHSEVILCNYTCGVEFLSCSAFFCHSLTLFVFPSSHVSTIQ